MKKILVAICVTVVIVAGCKKGKQYTQDLTGNWYVYDVTYFNMQTGLTADTILDDSITFTSGGLYTNINLIQTVSATFDTSHGSGKWYFQDSYGQLVLTDTANVPHDTFTVLNLTGNTVELLRNGYDHYMRKNQ